MFKVIVTYYTVHPTASLAVIEIGDYPTLDAAESAGAHAAEPKSTRIYAEYHVVPAPAIIAPPPRNNVSIDIAIGAELDDFGRVQNMPRKSRAIMTIASASKMLLKQN